MTQELELCGRQDRVGRRIRRGARNSSQQEQAPSDDAEDSEGVAKRVIRLELTLLEGAAGLQRFEEFLDEPARLVVVDDGVQVLRGIDGLRGEEHPIDGRLARW